MAIPRPKKKLTKGQILFIREMPKTLMYSFKAWCSLRGITMKAKLTQLMRECIKETEL